MTQMALGILESLRSMKTSGCPFWDLSLLDSFPEIDEVETHPFVRRTLGSTSAHMQSPFQPLVSWLRTWSLQACFSLES